MGIGKGGDAMMPASQPVETWVPVRSGLAVVGPHAVAPPPPEPPCQPWLRGAAAVALIRREDRDPSLPARRPRAPFLFRHPRRARLEQLLVLRGSLLPFAIGPAPLQRTRTVKLPVIGRRGRVSAKSQTALDGISDGELTPLQLRALFAENPRPQSREECEGGIRPCPWVSCRHHLFLEVHATSGAIRLNHPGVALEDMKHTCSLDLAAAGVSSLSETAKNLGISHERVRQIEVQAQDAFAAARATMNRKTTLR